MTVPLRERAYPVLVGDGACAELASVVPAGSSRAAVVTQAGIGVGVDPGIPFETFVIPDGEQAKEMATVVDLCRDFARFGLTRRDVVVSVGGGVVTDVAGFAAAVYHRGVAVVHVPTTLLGQIDAAIGGKTGVNLPEGKNLVGAFWQPSGVLCDTGPEVLGTLPAREMRAGYGELAKYHFIGCSAEAANLIGEASLTLSLMGNPQADGDSPLFRSLARLRRGWTHEGESSSRLPQGELAARLQGGTALEELQGAELVAACVAIKAEVVASDETESGRRALLNYGHTLGHALEIAGRFDLRHGEAVAVGLRYAAVVARLLGRIDDDRVAAHERVLEGYGLDGALPAGVDHDEIIELFGRDKKAADGITFVLDGPRGLEVVPGVDPGVLRSALGRM